MNRPRPAPARSRSLAEETAEIVEHLGRAQPVGGSVARVVRAALESFSERGYHGTTTRDISRLAGLSPAGIYLYFQSKAELLEIIVISAHERVVQMMEERARGARDPVERLRALMQAHVEFHARWHTAARIANNELRALGPSARRRVLQLRERAEVLVEETITEGIRQGSLAARDVRAAVFAVLSVGIGVSRWFTPGGRLGPRELGEYYGELVVRMLTAPR